MHGCRGSAGDDPIGGRINRAGRSNRVDKEVRDRATEVGGDVADLSGDLVEPLRQREARDLRRRAGVRLDEKIRPVDRVDADLERIEIDTLFVGIGDRHGGRIRFQLRAGRRFDDHDLWHRRIDRER